MSLGRASGSGLTFNLFGTELTYGQPVLYVQGSNPAIGGLVNGQIYWVIVPTTQYDPNGNEALVSFSLTQKVQLAASLAAAEDGIPIALTCDQSAPCTGTSYELEAVHVLSGAGANGIGISSILNATDESEATAGIADAVCTGSALCSIKNNSTINNLKNKKNSLTAGPLNALFNTFAWKLSTKAGSSLKQDQVPAKKSVGVTGAFAFIYANHTVTLTIGPGVQLTSGYNIYLQSNIDEDTQSSASSSIAGTPEDPDHKNSEGNQISADERPTSISLAIDVAVESNTATATVGAGAVLNAPDATFVISEVEYPLLTTIANLPTSVGELVGGLRGGSIAPSSITSLIASPSISEFAGFFGNGYSDATAQAEKTGIAGSITFLFFTNDAETHVGDNVSFNQTVAHPATSQVVVVYAENLEQLIGGAGQIKGSAQTGVSINPASKSDTSSGVGGSLNGLVLLNTTEATIGTGAIITTGPQGGTAINTDEYVMLIGFANGGRRGRQHLGQRQHQRRLPDEQHARAARHRRADHRRPGQRVRGVARDRGGRGRAGRLGPRHRHRGQHPR